jgi:hypothetical protein
VSSPELAETDALADPFPILRDAVLERAYTLAAFILGDAKRAKMVALEVATSLEVPYQIQKEVVHPSGRSRYKYKVKEPSLLLDQLIYEKITVHERQQEFEHLHGGNQLDDAALIRRFIKKIIEYSISHNTFYMVVGMHRVLFNYNNNEARKIYQRLAPGIDDKKPGADDFRHHKKRFIDILERRFRCFVDVVEVGDQHECRFKKRIDSSRYYLLVEQTLNLLKPSLAQCLVSADDLENLADGRRLPSSHAPIQKDEDENLIEKERMHMLTHLFCFSRLHSQLGLAPLERALELPQFKTIDNGGDRGSSQFHRPDIIPLTAAEKKKMYAELDKRQKRRKKMSPEQIEVVIDSVKRGTLSLNETRHVSIELDEGAGIIEFIGSDKEGNLPLGMYPLSWDESAVTEEPESYQMRIKGDRELEFTITYSKDINGDLTSANMLCSYSELHQPIMVPPPVAKLHDWLSYLTPGFVLQASPSKLVAGAFCSLLVFSTFLYMTTRQNSSGDDASERTSAEIALPHATSVVTSVPQQPPPQSDDHANQQVASVVEYKPIPKKAGARRAKAFLNETVDVKAPTDLIVSDTTPPLATLSPETSRKVISSEIPGVLPAGTEVVTLPVTDRHFVKLTDLLLVSNSANFDATAFLAARRIFVKPFAATTLSQVVYSNLIQTLQANRYTISGDMSKAEVILEGRVVERTSGVTLSVLVNNSDGSLIWLKSLDSQSQHGAPTLVAADLSARVVKSLSDERRDNSYVALDYYLSLTTKVSQDRHPVMPNMETDEKTLLEESRGETEAITKVRDGLEAAAGTDAAIDR